MAVLTPAMCHSRVVLELLEHGDPCWSTWVPAEGAINQGRTTICLHLLNPHAHRNEKWELKLSAKCKQCSWGSPSWGKETTQKWQREADGQIHSCEQQCLSQEQHLLWSQTELWRWRTNLICELRKSGYPKLQTAFLVDFPGSPSP